MRRPRDQGRQLRQEAEPPRLSDGEWAEIKRQLFCARAPGGRPADHRRHFEGMRWVAWTGKPWRDLPTRFGNPLTVQRYYQRLRKNHELDRLLRAFPQQSSKVDAETHAPIQVRLQLACLNKLLERRPRGRAAAAGNALSEGGLSATADKPADGHTI